MAYNTAAKAYGNNRIETATPAELTLMLYEGAVKFCNIAIVGLEKNDYEKVNTNIQKCRFIIGHNHNRYSKTVSTTIDRFDILTLFILMQKFAQCINTSC